MDCQKSLPDELSNSGLCNAKITYFFGIAPLHTAHEFWSLRMGLNAGSKIGSRYTQTITFETFPFPWPPGKESQDDPRVQATAATARELVEQRTPG